MRLKANTGWMYLIASSSSSEVCLYDVSSLFTSATIHGSLGIISMLEFANNEKDFKKVIMGVKVKESPGVLV